MNSEELELSLRTEFENYLKSVISEMRQETAEFQNKIQSELDKQKSSFDDAFAAFSSRFDSEKEFDEAFTSSVSEHLRLARDEGAKITAEAFAEAEKLEKENAAPAAANYNGIRDAVNDISSKDSQATILKALVDHAAEFAPRGAFFIIKSEHFTGWKVFGANTHAAEEAIREISFPVSADTILGAAVRSVDTIDSAAGGYTEDSVFLDDLGFGRPDRMYAIPLIARGKAVAVLYADYGNGGAHLQHEALETLVRVAGLTVELTAAQSAKHEAQPAEPNETGEPTPVSYFETAPEVSPIVTAPTEEFSESSPFQNDLAVSEAAPINEEVYEPVAVEEVEIAEAQFDQVESQFETVPEFVEESTVEAEDIPAEVPDIQPEVVHEPVSDFTPSGSPFETTVEETVPAISSNGGFDVAHEPAVEVAAPVVATSGTRLSDRNVDLPIDVPEEERRSHNDARRFARLLVSEIKLYNEKKVIEGREASDLYSRLREAIDRSREMYDKRVQPPVASKFDYFHYELVNSLAEGDDARLGSGYPGAMV